MSHGHKSSTQVVQEQNAKKKHLHKGDSRTNPKPSCLNIEKAEHRQITDSFVIKSVPLTAFLPIRLTLLLLIS